LEYFFDYEKNFENQSFTVFQDYFSEASIFNGALQSF